MASGTTRSCKGDLTDEAVVQAQALTAYVVFETWDHLLRSIAAAAIRPP